jgi:hypothetical protein
MTKVYFGSNKKTGSSSWTVTIYFRPPFGSDILKAGWTHN